MKKYLETSAIRKLQNIKAENVYTSIFTLFELISGINSKEEFDIRKQTVEKIMQSEIYIDWDFVDKKLGSFFGHEQVDENFPNLLEGIIKALRKFSYKKFIKENLYIEQKDGSVIAKNVMEYLKEKDQKIENMRNICHVMFDESKTFIINKYKKEGLKGLAIYFWKKYEHYKFNTNRLNHAEAFVEEKQINLQKNKIEETYNKYNFKLFMTAQSIIFAKAVYIDGGTQNRNNPSDLLHLLYLNDKDSRIVSSDKIYKAIEGAIDYFKPIIINNEKDINEISEI